MRREGGKEERWGAMRRKEEKGDETVGEGRKEKEKNRR